VAELAGGQFQGAAVIRFGPWSTILGAAAGFGLLVSLLLLAARQNSAANRFLAALLFVGLLRLMPYVLGFAGFYDAYPWLSFAPFDLPLAIGPLLYLYVRSLVTAALPRRWALHFAPAAIDLAYNLCAFSLPLAQKLRWNDVVHVRWIDPLESLTGILSLAIYLAAAARLRRRYQTWLTANTSDRHDHRQPWIGTVLTGLGAWLAATTGFDVVDRFVVHLSYFNRFPQYLLFSAIILWLGLEGWRHANHAFPPMTARLFAPQPPARDWPATARDWADEICSGGWWREPGLSLTEVARRLATNESYVSRAFNQGLGLNFNAVINGFRVDAVKAALVQESTELLPLALDCGFSSKASFNRVFREHTGQSPSAWRAAHFQESRQLSTSEATPREAGA
jgi:AraC-like DNA-binding protein